eukprot:TRINITY_DN35035_c0_g1_i1.p1 TRINITY_DN35035_c0_g1~~TRINITY_DN35035_c0_g1_i1.p1  ORF type:complete len:864 (+),score=133.88 TRINITY_DN35035_c0_g1_i1:105-2696(+)
MESGGTGESGDTGGTAEQIPQSDVGGTFWNSFGILSNGAPQVSPLEELLAEPDCDLEAVLQQEDVLPEYKAGNERLILRLTRPDAVLRLIEFITVPPPEGAAPERIHRFPFLAVELISYGAERVFEAMACASTPEIFNALWGFLDAPPNEDCESVLAGYFSRAAMALFTKNQEGMTRLIHRQGLADSLFDRFLEWLHFRAVAELFVRMLCVEQMAELVFPVPGLAERLLRPFVAGSGAHHEGVENAALIAIELLNQRESLFYGDDFLRQLSSPSVVGLLADQVFDALPSTAAAASKVLSNILFQVCVAPRCASQDGSAITLSPLSPPLTLHSEDEAPVVAADGVAGSLDEFEAAPKVMSSPPRSPISQPRAEAPAQWLSSRSQGLLKEFSPLVPRMRVVLDDALERAPPLGSSLPSSSGRPTLGSSTLEVVNLLAMLLRGAGSCKSANSASAIMAIIDSEQLLTKCWDLVFRHPLSGPLHNAVRALMDEVFNATDPTKPTLLLGLLHNGGLIQKVAEEFKNDMDVIHVANGDDVERPRRVRPGYMGHLHLVCSRIQKFAWTSVEVFGELNFQPAWYDVVEPVLEALNRLHAEELGGGINLPAQEEEEPELVLPPSVAAQAVPSNLLSTSGPAEAPASGAGGAEGTDSDAMALQEERVRTSTAGLGITATPPVLPVLGEAPGGSDDAPPDFLRSCLNMQEPDVPEPPPDMLPMEHGAYAPLQPLESTPPFTGMVGPSGASSQRPTVQDQDRIAWIGGPFGPPHTVDLHAPSMTISPARALDEAGRDDSETRVPPPPPVSSDILPSPGPELQHQLPPPPPLPPPLSWQQPVAGAPLVEDTKPTLPPGAAGLMTTSPGYSAMQNGH